MDLSIQDWGAIGEIIGGVAVVITLVYVAIQIRQNSKVSEAVALQSWNASAALEKSSLFSDAEFVDLFFRGCQSMDTLSATEHIRFTTYLIQMTNSFELLYFQTQNQIVENSFFEGKAAMYLRTLQLPGVRSFWEENKSVAYDKRFQKYVDAQLTQ